MNMTNEQYKAYSDAHQPRSRLWRNVLRAFWVGGAICCIGQLITNGYLSLGLRLHDAQTACSVTLIFIAALLTGVGVYDRIAKYAGGGTLVPITGFANSVAAPALEFKAEGLITGTAAKMFVISGPVIVYGVGASTVYGLILYSVRLF